MAVAETYVAAPPERCFGVLSDPRSYAYWVVGSREIRAADPEWPAAGSKFHHTLKGGLGDETVVEEVEPNRRLRLRARARPFGTAFVTVTMRSVNGGSVVRIEEEPADRLSRLLFNRFLDRLLEARNLRSISRLKELAEGSVPMPRGDLRRSGEGSGGIQPTPPRAADPAAGFGRGFFAGLVGGVAMSASTAADMRLTGRDPSQVPARALQRIFGIEKLGRTGERRMTAAAHFATSGLVGGAWGAVATRAPARPARLPLLVGAAATPDLAVVPAMGLAPPPWRWSAADATRTAVHHAVFASVAYLAFRRLES